MNSRRAIAIRQTLAFAGLLLVVLLVVAKCTGCTPLSAADKRAIAHDAVRIEVCKQKGRDCKADSDAGDCFSVYDKCIVDAGLRGGP